MVGSASPLSEYIFAQDIGDVSFLLSPLKYISCEVIFMEVTGEHIERLLAQKN